MARHYNAGSISVLDEMEGVRTNPGMYLGDVDSNGTRQCFNEIWQNATDEATECGGGRVRIVIRGDTVTVADEGRGIPVEIHPKSKISTLTTVLTRLHAGGKTSGKSAYGSRTIGVHGVGASVVNALSSYMRVLTSRAGKWYSVEFSRGRIVHDVCISKPPGGRWARGTIVEYRLDKSILNAPLDVKAVRSLCDIGRHFSPVTVELDLNGTKEVLEPRRPQQLLERIIRKTGDEIILGPVSVSVSGIRLIAAWTKSPDCRIQAHVAGASVPSGTHVQGLEDACRVALQTVAGRTAKGVEDATVGLVAVLDVSVDQPAFSGQAKNTLRTKAMRRIVREAVTPLLTKFMKANRAGALQIAEHAAAVNAIDREYKERRKLSKDTKGVRGKLSLPKGLVAALAFPASKRELYIVEGTSAKGTGKYAKEPWQEILPIRGKLPNLFKRKKDVGANEIVNDVIRAIGYDSARPDRPLRVNKIVLLVDADDDGDHIACLLLVLILKRMPELLRDGLIYLVDAPLFEAQSKDGTMVSGDVLADMERKYGKLSHVNRMKGWGGCEVPLLNAVAFNPATRRLLQVSSPTMEEKTKFEQLLGSDTAGRKELLGTSVSETQTKVEDHGQRNRKRSLSQRQEHSSDVAIKSNSSKKGPAVGGRLGSKRGAITISGPASHTSDDGRLTTNSDSGRRSRRTRNR